MLNETQSNAILIKLEELGIKRDSLLQASDVFLASQFICVHSGNKLYDTSIAAEIMHSTSFYDFCDNVRIDLNSIPDHDFLVTYNRLCHDLELSPFRFYNFLYPYLVHDCKLFVEYVGDSPLRIAIMLHVLIHIASQYEESSIPLELEPEDTNSWKKALAMCFPSITEGERVSLCMDLWLTCFRTQLAKPCFKKRKAIISFLEVCKVNGLNPADYLRDYQKVYLEARTYKRYKEHLAAAHADPYFEKYSADLITALVGLRSEPPTYLMHFLPNVNSSDINQDDYEFEASFGFCAFDAICNSAHQILVAYPSPGLIRYICSNSLLGSSANILVENKLICELYGAEFPNYHFVSPDDIAEGQHIYDRVLIFNYRSFNKPSALPTRILRDDAIILTLIPQTFFSNKRSVETLYKNNVHIDRIIAVPPELTKTKPLKKALVYARKVAPGITPPPVQLFFAHPCIADFMYVSKSVLTFDHTELFCCRTLIQLRNALNPSSKACTKKTAGTTKVYYFSREIRVHYTLLSGRGSKYSAQVCYRAILNANQKFSIRGKALIERTEQGFRRNTAAEVLDEIALFPLRPSVYNVIAGDVINTYKSRTKELSLKTLWYCCLGRLSQLLTYKHEVAVSLFCSSESEKLSNIIPSESTEEDFLSILGDNAPVKWNQIVLILNEAVKHQLIESNPIKNSFTTIKYSTQPALQIVRHNLTKPDFSEREEAAIVDFFMKTDSKSGLPLCFVNSQYLAIAIRLFTGMNVREICALQWKNFVGIEKLDLYQIMVVQHLNDSGQPISNAHYSGRKAHRKIPCLDFLTRVLLGRLNYIMATYGYSVEDIKEHPMILMTEYPSKKSKKCKVNYCSIRKITALSKAAFSVAGIKSNIVRLMDYDTEIEVDLNASRADLFRSNFRIRANHTCQLTAGELCYISGIKAVRTYDEHYADYSSPLSQLSIRLALDIWANKYIPLLESLPQNTSSYVIQVTSGSSESSIRLSNQYGMDCMALLLLE